MAQCPNCKARITCGCQRRSASNGAATCTRCQSNYEKALKAIKPGGAPAQKVATPVVRKASSTPVEPLKINQRIHPKRK